MVSLQSFIIALKMVNRTVHIGELKDSLSGKGITVLVSSSVFVRNKLHRRGIISINYTLKLEYVWLSVRVKISP